MTGSSTTSITQGGGDITCEQPGYTGNFTNSCFTNGGTVSGVCGCNATGGYVLNSATNTCVLSSSITCNVAAESGFAAKLAEPRRRAEALQQWYVTHLMLENIPLDGEQLAAQVSLVINLILVIAPAIQIVCLAADLVQ